MTISEDWDTKNALILLPPLIELYFIALDKEGRYGAAGTGKGFQYAVTTPYSSEIFDSEALGSGVVGVEGGNL